MNRNRLIGKVCIFCGRYRIKSLEDFLEHLKTCNPAQYYRLKQILSDES